MLLRGPIPKLFRSDAFSNDMVSSAGVIEVLNPYAACCIRPYELPMDVSTSLGRASTRLTSGLFGLTIIRSCVQPTMAVAIGSIKRLSFRILVLDVPATGAEDLIRAGSKPN
jgi:hypothetical protein